MNTEALKKLEKLVKAKRPEDKPSKELLTAIDDALLELMENMKSVDTESDEAEGNEETLKDDEGHHIFYDLLQKWADKAKKAKNK